MRPCSVPTRIRTLLALLCVLATLPVSAQTPLPHLFVLSIGIDQYRDLPHLRSSVKDATAISAAFSTETGAAFSGVTSKNLINPTLAEIISAMQAMAHAAQPSDVFLLYFSGAGVRDANGYNFAALDTALPQGNMPAQHALSPGRLSALLLQIPATREILILDTTDSAQAVDAVRKAFQPKDSFSIDAIHRQIACFSVHGGGVLDGGDSEHGLITSVLLQGLKGGADAKGDGIITESELESYLSDAVMIYSAGTTLSSYSNMKNLVLVRTPERAAAEHRAEILAEQERRILREGPRIPDASRMGAIRGSARSEASAESALSSSDITLNSAAADTPVDPTRSASRKPASTDASHLIDLGHDYALIVATDHYAAGWNTLKNPIFDATSLQDELIRDYGFDKSRITLLPDARKRDVVAAIKQFIADKGKFGPNDRMLVYFAGHGIKDPIDGYVAFADSKSPDEDDSLNTLMNFSMLSTALNAIPVPHLLLVMDVCYGGVFDARTAFHSLLGETEDDPSDRAPRDQLIARMLRARSRIYLTSGDENHEVSDGKPGQHSPFSRALLRQLQQRGGQNQLLDIATLYSGLRSLAMEPRAGYFDRSGAEQNADFVLIPTTPSAQR